MGTETDNIFHSTSVAPGWDRTRTKPKWQISSVTKNCNVTTCYNLKIVSDRKKDAHTSWALINSLRYHNIQQKYNKNISTTANNVIIIIKWDMGRWVGLKKLQHKECSWNKEWIMKVFSQHVPRDQRYFGTQGTFQLRTRLIAWLWYHPRYHLIIWATQDGWPLVPPTANSFQPTYSPWGIAWKLV